MNRRPEPTPNASTNTPSAASVSTAQAPSASSTQDVDMDERTQKAKEAQEQVSPFPSGIPLSGGDGARDVQVEVDGWVKTRAQSMAISAKEGPLAGQWAGVKRAADSKSRASGLKTT